MAGAGEEGRTDDVIRGGGGVGARRSSHNGHLCFVCAAKGPKTLTPVLICRRVLLVPKLQTHQHSVNVPVILCPRIYLIACCLID